MYNYVGLIDLATSAFIFGIIAFLGCNPFSENNRKQKKHYFGIGALILLVILGGISLSYIDSDNVQSFTGEFTSVKHNDKDPFSQTFYFENEEKTHYVMFTVNSRKELLEESFQKNQDYTIYYIEVPIYGNVCVKVDKIESS